MPDETPQIGIQGIFDADPFLKGMQAYTAGIDKSVDTTGAAAVALGEHWGNIDKRFATGAANMGAKAKGGFDAVATSMQAIAPAASVATVAGGNLSSMLAGAVGGAAAGLAGGALTMLVGALGNVRDAFFDSLRGLGDFIGQAIQGESRGRELALAAQFLGQQAGWSAQRINELQAGLEAAGATGDTASLAIAKFAQRNLDASQAADLLKIAQGASIITGKGVQETYDSLIDSISSLQVRSLKGIGIIVDQQRAEEEYARSLGKTRDALNEDERAQALLNATIEQGQSLMGLYAAGMAEPAAQMRNLTDTLIPELMDRLGAPFQMAFGSVLDTISRLVEGLTAAVSEGGALYPVLIALGTAASIFADALGYVVDGLGILGSSVLDALLPGLRVVGATFEQTADAALDWGVNVTVQFADGLIQGAAAAITAAMDYISNMLFSWLAPGSPPRVAPQLDEWGLAAIGQWLHGFTMGDFSALEAIQRPLQAALQLVIGSGEDAKAQIGQIFGDLSAEIMQAIAGGAMSQSLFDKIAASTGEFGNEIAALAQQQVALAAAEREAELAQKRLTEAQNASKAAGAAVNSMTREYNAMLRGGASKEALAAKLKEIRAAEEAKKLADAQVKEAQKDSDTAKDKVDLLKEQVALQAKLVEQLLALARAGQAGTARVPPGGGAPAGRTGGITPSIMPRIVPPDMSGFGNVMDGAIQRIKDKIYSALMNLFLQLKAKWDTTWKALLVGILVKWEQLKAKLVTAWAVINTTAGVIWDSIAERISQAARDIYDWVTARIDELSDWLSGAWEDISAVVSAAWGDIVDWISQAAEDIYDWVTDVIGDLQDWLDQAWDDISGAVSAAWDDIVEWISQAAQDIYDWVSARIGELQDWLETAWQNISGTVSTAWASIVNWISQAATDIYNWVTARIAELRTWLETAWGNIQQSAQSIWNAIVLAVSTAAQGIYNTIVQWIDDAREWISRQWNAWYAAGLDLLNKLREGAWEKLAQLRQNIEDWIGGARQWISDQWNYWYGAGVSLLNELRQGAETKLIELYNSIRDWINGARQWIGNQWNEWVGAGSQLIAAIITGILGGAGGLEHAIQSSVQGAINGILAMLGLPPIQWPGFRGPTGGYGGVGSDMGSLALQSALSRAAAPLALMPLGGGGGGSVYNFNLGGNQISDSMSLAVFEARVERVIERRLGGH